MLYEELRPLFDNVEFPKRMGGLDRYYYNPERSAKEWISFIDNELENPPPKPTKIARLCKNSLHALSKDIQNKEFWNMSLDEWNKYHGATFKG